MEWLKSAVQNNDIEDLASSWNDGRNLSALVDYCQPGLIPDHAMLDPEKRLENIRRAMDLAEKHLQIPQLMQPEDLAVDKPDKLSTMTYLSQFCCPNSVGEKRLFDFVHTKLPKHNITNFTTDWVDGRVLGALTAAVCQYEPQTGSANPTERCKEAMAAAEEKLFARKVLETSEFINPELDPRLRMAYLTELYHATQPPHIVGMHISDQVGAGQEIRVDLMVPQQGQIEATAFGTSTGAVTVSIEATSAEQSRVKIGIPVRDVYTVRITYGGKVIRGCPFVVPLDTYSLPHLMTNIPQKLGDPCSLTFDTSQIEAKPIEVNVTGERTGAIQHTIENVGSDRGILSFIPPCLDTYTVTVGIEGKPVKGSPYVLPLLTMVDPKKVVCGEVESSGVASPVNIAIDCRKAGKGTLTASCAGKACGDVPVRIITANDTPTAVTFIPNSQDLYLLHICYDGGEVPGSPWCIDFRNLPPQPNQVKVIGTPTGVIEVGKMISVMFDASEAGSGKLTASCSGTTCGDVPVSVVTIGMGKFQVGFVPMVPDNYFMIVYWAGVQVLGAPFQISFGCEPLNASKCRLVGLQGNPALIKVKKTVQGLIGQEIVLQVKTEGAGEGKLEVKMHTPSKEIIITPQQSSDDPHTQIVRYTPLYQGHHCMQLLWGGNAIPGSPIRFDAMSPLEFPLGGPITVQLELDGKKKALNGEAVLQKDGLPEKIMANVDSANNKISLDPNHMEPGTYILYVYSKYKELPNSPVVLVYGNKEAHTKEVSTEEQATVDNGPTAVEDQTKPAEVEADGREQVVEVAEHCQVILVDSVALESKPADTEVTKPFKDGQTDNKASKQPEGNSQSPEDKMMETLALTEMLAPEGSDISSVPRNRSFTSNLGPDKSLLLDIHTRSHSVGKRPEMMKTTTPTGEETFEVPMEDQKVHETDAPPLTTPIHSPLPLSSSPLHEVEETSNGIDDEFRKVKSEPTATGSIEANKKETANADKEQKVETQKEKGKKKSKDKDEEKAKSKKDKEKEKAENGRKEKEEKKKKEKKKKGGLNLEDQDFRVGLKMKYKLHCEDLGTKAPMINCNPPEAAKHRVIPAPQFGKNTYWCELTPTRVGNMDVSIVYEDFHILGSPFSVDVGPRGDASQCSMVESLSTCTKQQEGNLLFCISVPASAGKGNLVATVRSASTNKRITGVHTSPGTAEHYHVEFEPSEGLEYTLSVKYDEHHIEGSPFLINLGDPTKCKVHGEGIKQAQIEEENTFIVDATEAGPGELSVNIEKEGRVIESKITVTGDKEYRISYTVHTAGEYHIAVMWGEGHVLRSPFRVPCVAASQLSISKDSIPRCYAGGMTSIQVVSKAPHIRHKQLSVFAHPKEDITKMFSGEIVQSGDGAFMCFLRPTEEHIGPCSIHICWNGKEIKGSPYELTILDPPAPDQFFLEAVEADSGDITVHVNGPTDAFATEMVVATVNNLFTDEKIPEKVTKLTNEKCKIELLPTIGGEYQLSILYVGKHIANSPLVLTQSDPSQCKISGEGIRVSKVNELSKFTVDHSKAGLGHLKVDIEGEGGSTIEPFIASGETLSEVTYIARHAGVYRVIVHWGDHKLPGSPFVMYTVNPSKFSLKGSMPKTATVGQTMRYMIEASGTVEDWDRLSITAKLRHQEKVYRGTVKEEGAGRKKTYRCALDIPEAGRYAVYVQCRGLDIQGSPFTIHMMPPPEPNKVCVSGEGLTSGTIGQKQKFIINTREAGHGHISLKVKGPNGGFTIDMHQHETSNRLVVAEYTPEYPGKYTIHIMWAGVAIPGSPYSVFIQGGHHKRKVRDSQNEEWVSG